VSTGAVAPAYWALTAPSTKSPFEPKRAAELIAKATNNKGLRLSCLVAGDSVDERIALNLKRQLAPLGVDLAIEEASRNEIVRRASAGDYQTAVIEVIGGPTLLRLYSMWHSGGATNWGKFGSQSIDAALDKARYAASEADYRQAVAAVDNAFFDDPPAVFLAWSVRARAASKRFDIPAEEGRDILSTMRLWRPATVPARASRN
jgi:ABC-type transport system substrate-binding protein